MRCDFVFWGAAALGGLVPVPGWVAENYQEKIKIIQDRGHEIAALGYQHENMALLTEEEQESVMKKSIAAIEKVCGIRPKGFRSPEGELTLDTLRIAKKSGMLYSSNLCDDDRPYFKDLENGEELLRYDLGEDFSIETAAVFGELYKHGDEWKFNAIGSGYQGGLAALCNNYGVDVE